MMIETRDNVMCAEFQAQLPDLIGSGANISDHEHIQSCATCRALLADLESIAEAARQLFPVVEPPDDLWQQIETAMKNEQAPDRIAPGRVR
jgi:hypothetical protein